MFVVKILVNDLQLNPVVDPDLQLGKGGFEGLTMNVEFCKDNSGSSKKMCYFQKKEGP